MASSSQSSPFALSSVGTKMVVAVTGLGLLLFVIAHMLGNLQIYAGPEAINSYAYKLKSMPAILWGARLGLLAIFLLHIGLTVKLWRDNHAARGDKRNGLMNAAKAERYRGTYRYLQASPASRNMLWTGLMILLFVLYHLCHFTLHTVSYPTESFDTAAKVADSKLETRELWQLAAPNDKVAPVENVYAMIVHSFENPFISLIYIAAQLLLAAHLFHGAQSVLQTLGLRNERRREILEKAGKGLAIIIAIGNCSIPLAVLFGIVGF